MPISSPFKFYDFSNDEVSHCQIYYFSRRKEKFQ